MPVLFRDRLRVERGRWLRSVGFMALAVAVLSGAASAEFRTWTDSTGAFKIEAELVSQTSGKVTLRQRDGEELEIELTKLSPADQDYLKRQADNPFKPKAANPFQPKSATPPATPSASPSSGRAMPSRSTASVPPRRGGTSAGSRSGTARQADLSSAALLNLMPEADEWKVEVTQAPATGNAPSRAIPLPKPPTIHERVTNFVFNSAGTHAAVGYKQDAFVPEPITRIVICDTRSGRVIAKETITAAMKLLALSDDGKTVVMTADDRPKPGTKEDGPLEVWTVTSGGIQEELAWVPFQKHGVINQKATWGALLPDGTLVAASNMGDIAGFRVSDGTPLWTCKTTMGMEPAISPDGRLMALATGDQVCLVDLEQQQAVGTTPLPGGGGHAKFAFSTSGQRFACMTNSKVYVWETATGELYREIDFGGLAKQGLLDPPVFADDEHLLIGNTYLIDLATYIPLWQYKGARQMRALGDRVWIVASEALLPTKLPHPAAKQQFERVSQDPGFFVLRPGSQVRLNLNGIPDAEQRTRIEKSLTERFLEKEITVDPSAELEVICSFGAVNQKALSYIAAGAVVFNEVTANIKIVSQGNTIWQSSGSNVPSVVRRKSGESLQDAVKRHEGPNYSFFTSVQLPRWLRQPTPQSNTATLGSSQITANGIR